MDKGIKDVGLESLRTNKQNLYVGVITLIVTILGLFFGIPKLVEVGIEGFIIVLLVILLILIWIIPLYLSYRERNVLVNWFGAVNDLAILKIKIINLPKDQFRENTISLYNQRVKGLYVLALYEGKEEFAREFLDKFLIKEK